MTLPSGWATRSSRSRKVIRITGATPGQRQAVAQVRVDCAGDRLLYGVAADGPACHRQALMLQLGLAQDDSLSCDRAVMVPPLARPPLPG